MKRTVAVALSGGLDSSVAAALLKGEDYRVIGLHFQTGYESSTNNLASSVSNAGTSQARQVAKEIGIEFESIDCSKAFQQKVVNYFIDTYASGQTPSPCVVCNPSIKFGPVLKKARQLGASALATGHYARIKRGPDGRFRLLKGIDSSKDQSYFLSRLTQEHLSQAIFPLGNYTKKEARNIAKVSGLTSFTRKESQELCFVSSSNYKEFLSEHGKLSLNPGPIVNAKDEVLGQHQGLYAYTIGQRRGIGIPGAEPYYVVGLDITGNRLIIGTKSESESRECTVTNINWIGTESPEKPISAQTRIRYRHREAESIITPLDHYTAKVTFSKAQQAITPGQAAVFYQEERVLGGGWIVL
ncbi:MAG: tRNA 2-thiouridine(34) synthase MnmA [Deltaproteobacteria bacterium]|nr:tRNA 2-thiouridine(34) synthase MnmA [Deltaproteobacteria bacterium]MBW2600496.1 tRNA 2-thiouridine(34) synthase MnmA [Deltaproteobacteria bacterium]